MITLTTPEVKMNKGTVNYKENYKEMPISTIADSINKQNLKKASNDTCKTYFNLELINR